MEAFKKLIDRHTGYILLFPAILASLFVHVYPTVDAVRISFFDFQLLHTNRPFVGWGNFVTVLQDPAFIQVFGNTIIWTILSLIVGGATGLIVAIFLNRPYPGRGFLRALFLVPWVTPPVVVAIIFRSLLSQTFSPINGLLMNLHWIDSPINFLGNLDLLGGIFSVPLLTIVAINVWCTFSFMMVMFLAGLQTIPPELYEAARVDGASKHQQFWRITWPSILPVVETVALLQGIWQFNNFNISYLVTHGGPLHATELLSVEVYNEAFNNFRFGTAAALSVIMMLIILIPAVFYVRRSVKHVA